MGKGCESHYGKHLVALFYALLPIFTYLIPRSNKKQGCSGIQHSNNRRETFSNPNVNQQLSFQMCPENLMLPSPESFST